MVTPLPDFRLGDYEPLPVGLKRLTLGEMENAASGFFDGEEAFGLAVHEARRSSKRIRAVLRLIRYELGDQIFKFEDRWMRDTAKLVSPVRDAAALVESVDVLDRIYGHLLVDGALAGTRQRLDVRRGRLEMRVMEDPAIVVTVVEKLEKAHGRYANWPVDPSAKHIYGVGIRDSFEAIGPGLTHTYRRGRREMVSAYTETLDASKFHEWRKSVKYLRHQMELLTPIWPEVVVGMAVTLERIGELLGQDHDLAMLLQKLDADAALGFADSSSRSGSSCLRRGAGLTHRSLRRLLGVARSGQHRSSRGRRGLNRRTTGGQRVTGTRHSGNPECSHRVGDRKQSHTDGFQ
ncbi:MAG: CHAD domain-containing protein [Actinobacteria bacterium]|nr:MAG: CHAD domain-containing protein [Actinomycetota bacterium]